MKKIKYFYVTLFAVIFNAYFISCSGDDYSSPLKGQNINDLVFETGTNSKTITINNKDLSSCTITSSTNWCNVSIQGSSIIIYVQTNNTYEERQATITISDPKDNTELSFRVLQNQNNAILVEGNSFTIPEEGGEISIKIQSNVDYTIEIPANASWLTKTSTSTRGLSNSTITFKATKNDSGDEREAVIKLTDSSSETTTRFTIKQDLTPNIFIEKEEYSIDEKGGTIEIKVKSNIVLQTIINDKWASDGGRIDIDNYNFTQKIEITSLSENHPERSVMICFIDKNGKWKITKEVKVTQTIDSRKYIKAVDLGLSVDWASCNLGAMEPEDYGWYYAWGETKPKTIFTSNNYSYYDHDLGIYTYLGDNICGTKYDAAYVYLDGNWRTPTYNDFKELMESCEWKWIKINGIKGYKIIGKNGNSIFLPAAGEGNMNGIVSKQLWLYYMTSTMIHSYMFVLWGSSSSIRLDSGGIIDGYPIRPIKIK